MPFLYESRQHKRNGRESLDCAMALQELMGRGMILMNSYNSTVQIFAIFGLMALIYFVVCFTLSQIVRAYQRRLKGAR